MQTFLSNLVALIITFLIAYFFHVRNKSKVKLDVHLLYDTSLLEVDNSIKEKLEEESIGRKVENIYTARFAIVNSGNAVITNDNIIEPIIIKFGKYCKLTNPYKISTPEGFNFIYKIETDDSDNELLVIEEIDKLSPKESIDFDITVISEYLDISVSGITFPGRKNVELKKRTKHIDNIFPKEYIFIRIAKFLAMFSIITVVINNIIPQIFLKIFAKGNEVDLFDMNIIKDIFKIFFWVIILFLISRAKRYFDVILEFQLLKNKKKRNKRKFPQKTLDILAFCVIFTFKVVGKST